MQPQTPADPAAPLKLLAAGKVDLAISYEPELLLARDKGLKLVSVGALVQRPLTSIIALPQGTSTVAADLAGQARRHGRHPLPGGRAADDRCRRRRDPASVKEVNVGFNLVPAMLSKKVDATLGGFWNYEGIQLRSLHKHPTIIPSTRPACRPTTSSCSSRARTTRAHRRRRTCARSCRRSRAATTRCARDPAAGVERSWQAAPDLDRRLQLASMKATLPAFFPTQRGKPFGWQDPARWVATEVDVRQPPARRRPPAVFRAGDATSLPAGATARARAAARSAQAPAGPPTRRRGRTTRAPPPRSRARAGRRRAQSADELEVVQSPAGSWS